MDYLTAYLKVLADARDKQAKCEADWKKLNKMFKASPKYKFLYDSLKLCKSIVAEAEDAVRAEAVKAYDGVNKKPVKGIGIQESYSYEADYANALLWCEINLPIALVTTYDQTLFTKAIEQLDKQGKLPDFVTKVKNVKATIATDLSFLLEDHTHE